MTAKRNELIKDIIIQSYAHMDVDMSTSSCITKEFLQRQMYEEDESTLYEDCCEVSEAVHQIRSIGGLMSFEIKYFKSKGIYDLIIEMVKGASSE